MLLDGNLSLKKHLKFVENKIVKNIGITYKAKPYLKKDSLLELYFCYIHSYIDFANLVCGITQRTYLQETNSQQKDALKSIHNKKRLYHSKELFEPCEILNVFKLNLHHPAVFMHKINYSPVPSSFPEKPEQSSHSYPTRFSTRITENPK